MKYLKYALLILCLLCLGVLPAMAEETADVLVIKKFRNLKEVTEAVDASSASIIDISGTSTSIANIRKLMETYPDRTFRYRVRFDQRHIMWDVEELDLGYTKYKKTSDFTDLMDLLPNVTKVTSWGHVFTPEELDEFYIRYPKVERFYVKFKMAHHTIRTDLTAFCTRHARYTEDRHTQDDFAAFRHCPDLVALDVGHNAVTDLSFLEQLPKLRLLILADNRFTDISPLACQTELVYLELINNRITDISALANCPNLLDLHIGWCDITDATPLYGLKNLDRLWLAKNQIPQEQIDHLREIMPDCTINDTATVRSTAEGWRQGHPRYLKIQEIFGKDKYIPFP